VSRLTRARVLREAAGRRAPRRFGANGTFTVAAAKGGAASSDTVDLSGRAIDLTVSARGGVQGIEVQRDHRALVDATLAAMELTAETLPEDCRGSAPPRLWRITV